MSLNHRYYRTLPRWGRRLNKRFVAAFGKPAGLWTPCDVVNKAYDFSENLNTGILNGGVTVVPGGFGVLGQGWSFNKTNVYISIPNSTSLNPTAAITVWAIVYLNSVDLTNGQRIIAKWDGSHTWILEQASDGNFKFWVNNGTTTANAAFAATAGQWLFLCGTFDGSNIRIYQNGILKATTALSGSISTNTHAVYVGTGENANLAWLGGNVANIGISPSAFSPAQVSSLYSCILYGEPFPLFQSQIIKRRFSTRQNIVSSFKFRRTLSQFGTRIGSRQAIG